MLVMYWIRFCKWNKQVKCWHYTQDLLCIPAHDYVAVKILAITDLVFVYVGFALNKILAVKILSITDLMFVYVGYVLNKILQMKQTG